jgi:hypothetical protein
MADPTVSLDTLLGVGVTRAADLDAILGVPVAVTADLDVILGVPITAAVGLDALLQQTITRSVGLDALLQQTITHGANLDTYLGVPVVVTADLDAILGVARTRSASLDTYLGVARTRSASLDTILAYSQYEIETPVPRRPAAVAAEAWFQQSLVAADAEPGIELVPALAGKSAVLDLLIVDVASATFLSVFDATGTMMCAAPVAAGETIIPPQLSRKASAQGVALSMTTSEAVAVEVLYRYHYE